LRQIHQPGARIRIERATQSIRQALFELDQVDACFEGKALLQASIEAIERDNAAAGARFAG